MHRGAGDSHAQSRDNLRARTHAHTAAHTHTAARTDRGGWSGHRAHIGLRTVSYTPGFHPNPNPNPNNRQPSI